MYVLEKAELQPVVKALKDRLITKNIMLPSLYLASYLVALLALMLFWFSYVQVKNIGLVYIG